MEKLKETFLNKTKEYYSVCTEMRLNAVNFLDTFLRENGGEITNEDERGLLDGIGISYDGGNHPEYSSCIFSTIFAIRRGEDGTIFFDLEDEDNVMSDRITTDDLVYVVEQIIDLM